MCWHKWSKWSEVREVEYTRSSGSFGHVVYANRNIQTRICAKCNKVGTRTVFEGKK